MALGEIVSSLREGALQANPFTSPAAEPILSNLPEIAGALDRKYADPIVANLDAATQRTLAEIDLRRAKRNQLPTNAEQTANIIRAVQTGQLQTKPPERKATNVLGNFLHDLRNMVTAVPRIPIALAKEVQALPDFPAALSNPDDHRNVVAKLATAPGVRMVPGSYVVGNLAEGNVHELVTHPLMTALDVLPVATEAAAATKVGRAEATLAEALDRTARPIKAVALRKLDTAGNLVPNKLGELVDATARTRPGQMLSEAFGANARTVAFIENTGKLELMEAMNPQFSSRIAAIPDQARVAVMRDIVRLHNEFRDYTPDDMARVTRQVQLGDYANLSTRDLDLVARARQLTDTVGTWGTDDGYLWMMDGERFPAKQAALIMRARSMRNRMTMLSDARGAVDASLAGTLSVDDIAARIRDAASHPLSSTVKGPSELARLNRVDRYRVVNGYLHALDASGLDVGPLHTLWRESQRTKGKASTADFLDALDRVVQNPAAHASPILDPAAILPDLAKLGRTDPLVRVLVDHLKAGRSTEASQVARRIASRGKFRVPQVDNYIDSLARQARRDRYAASIDKAYDLSPKATKKLDEQIDRFERRYAPARFQPLINQRVGEEIANLQGAAKDLGITGPITRDQLDKIREAEQSGTVFSRPTPEAAEQTINAVMENRYADYVDFSTLRELQDDITATWRKMRDDEGLDPLFVHRISSGQAKGVEFPNPSEIAKRPSSANARSVDFTPGFQDLTVALTHQAQEFLARDISESIAEQLATAFGRPRDEVVRTYLAKAQEWSARDPRTSVAERLDELVKRDYRPFDPKEFGWDWPSERLDLMAREQMMIPNAIANTIMRHHTPRTFRLQTVLDPVTNAFRTALLPLSPRWHVNNVVGNGIMLLARTDPRAFVHWREALDWARNPELAPESLRRTFGGQTGMLREWDYQTASNAANFFGGRTLGRLYAQARESRLAKGLDKFKTASYDANQLVDNMSRAMGYLYQTKTKGLSDVRGMELARTTFQQWAELTPIERQIIRYVFPFYGFTQHVLRYVSKYPFDHPVRAAVMGSIARAELADMKDGLPERFLGMFFFGKGSTPGSKRGINLSSFNPFGDAANLMTMTGFLAGANPVLSTALEQLGFVDGRTELYPTLHYDPETGRLAASAPNPLMSLVGNVVPQTNLVTSLLGMNSEFNQRLTSDPSAAMRYLLSSAGLPLTYRQIDTSAEIARNELALEDAQSKAWNDSLKSGNLAMAARWPGLQDKLAQLEQLRAQGLLGQFSPSSLPTDLPAPNSTNTVMARASGI